MPTNSKNLRLTFLLLPVVFVLYEMIGSIFWLYAKFGKWIVPDLWVLQLLFFSLAPIVYWGCNRSLWRKIYLIFATIFSAFYMVVFLFVAFN